MIDKAIPVCVTLPPDLLHQIDLYKISSGRSRSELVSAAVAEYLRVLDVLPVHQRPLS